MRYRPVEIPCTARQTGRSSIERERFRQAIYVRSPNCRQYLTGADDCDSRTACTSTVAAS
jgi:hypothetical protein